MQNKINLPLLKQNLYNKNTPSYLRYISLLSVEYYVNVLT